MHPRTLALLVALLVIPVFSGARTWTATDGRSIEAEYLRRDGDAVVVRRAGQREETTIPLAMLSEADRKVVEELEAERNKPVPVEGEGIFGGRVTGEWEKLEFGSLQFRFLGNPTMDAKQSYPVLIFLHGKGSGGTDNEKQLGGQMRNFASGEFYTKHPCFILVPQCPDDSIGWNGEYLADAIKLVEEASEKLPVDEDRLYITGLSMGGFGTWAAIAQEPKLFAAAVPVCGGGNPASARSIKKVPIWAHHGAIDDVVDVEYTRQMVEALEDAKGNIKYTEYPDVKHNAWDPCYQNLAVWEWMFAQKRE